MTELAERLRQLRRQAGATPGPVPVLAPAQVASPHNDGLKALLRRQLAVREPATQAPLATRPALQPPSADACAGIEVAPGLFEHIERLALSPPPSWQWLPDLHPRLLPSDCLLHFDTETTGLAGGTGTRAFMLGFARWCDHGLELRQLWIRRLGAEAAMLERFAQWLSEGAFQLVSYNGRSFDAPLLRGRYRLCRMRDPLDGLPHHDLLHAVRRRFRSAWPSCRLAEAEARLLGVSRADDLPGAEAPAAFLASLRSGDPRPLERVRRHHRQDLISLATLLPRLAALSAQAPADWRLGSAAATGC
jgi:uncharacterized protein YprB with RNaseH-like and TPR domain